MKGAGVSTGVAGTGCWAEVGAAEAAAPWAPEAPLPAETAAARAPRRGPGGLASGPLSCRATRAARVERGAGARSTRVVAGFVLCRFGAGVLRLWPTGRRDAVADVRARVRGLFLAVRVAARLDALDLVATRFRRLALALRALGVAFVFVLRTALRALGAAFVFALRTALRALGVAFVFAVRTELRALGVAFVFVLRTALRALGAAFVFALRFAATRCVVARLGRPAAGRFAADEVLRAVALRGFGRAVRFDLAGVFALRFGRAAGVAGLFRDLVDARAGRRVVAAERFFSGRFLAWGRFRVAIS